jgi:branched-subunit amino acid transport protein
VTWLAIIAVGVGSYVLRALPLVVLPRVTVPDWFDRAMRDAGLAAITALLVTSVNGRAATGDLVPTLAAVGVGIALALRGKAMLHVVWVGGAAYASVLLAVRLAA